MTDIVERLREVGLHLGDAIAGYRDDDLKRAARGAVDIAKVTREAAAEIERLRADNHRLMMWNEELQARVDALSQQKGER